MPASPAAEVLRVARTRLERHADWLCIGHTCWSGDAPGTTAAWRFLDGLAGLTGRMAVRRWVRYRVDLALVPAPADDVQLTPLTAEAVAVLRNHPDHHEEAFASGLGFWDQGLRSGFVWYEDGQPLCFQWLLSDADTATLRAAQTCWTGMYPPLASGTAQVEKLWTFSTARKKGIASRFALAMFAEARKRGVRTLLTHIHEANQGARSWAQRTGWQSYGTIARYELDLPIVRAFNLSVCVHSRDEDSSLGR
jgi:GNAT superfamily N-acetyltransferase